MARQKSNSRFANEFGVARTNLHYWHNRELAYIPRGGSPQQIFGRLGAVTTRIQDTEGNRRIIETRMCRLHINPDNPEYAGISYASMNDAIAELNAGGNPGKTWTIEDVAQPHDETLEVRLTRARRTDLTATNRFNT